MALLDWIVFSMIMRTLQKIHRDQATGFLVVPFWPTQAWWPVLTKMLIKEPLVIPSRKITLILPQDPKAAHPLFKQMLLLLCHLSGNTYKAKEFLHQLPTLSCIRDVPVQGCSTDPTSRNGLNIVVIGKLIQFHLL